MLAGPVLVPPASQGRTYAPTDARTHHHECNCISRTIVIIILAKAVTGPPHLSPAVAITFNKSTRIANRNDTTTTTIVNTFNIARDGVGPGAGCAEWTVHDECNFSANWALLLRETGAPHIHGMYVGVFRFLISYTIRRVFPRHNQACQETQKREAHHRVEEVF